MIQRIQSVYFGIAGIITLLLLWVNIAFFSVADGYQVSINALGIHPNEAIAQLSIDVKPIALTITVLVAGILPLIALFMFKNRAIQIRLGRITIALLAAIIAQCIINVEDIYRQIQILGYEKNYFVGFILPIIAIIITALAIRGVKKDEALVKSMDRIR
jgi:hypothetical protein